MPKVLYIAYWGALEPLGQSLIVPAVEQLAQLGADLTLITFEKTQDLARKDEVEQTRKLFQKVGINWIPLRYHKTPKNPATAFDISLGIVQGVLQRIKGKFDVVHARTFIGGLAGMILASLIRAKFIYHNEGFYPDEQVDGGVWQLNSRTYKIAKRLENIMYERADGIIALSHRAKAVIAEIPKVKAKQTPIIFVPSCVNLNLFKMRQSAPDFPKDTIDFVYIGSIGNRYILDRIAHFVAVAESLIGKVHLQIYSKADQGLVRSMVKQGGLRDEYWNQNAVTYNEMPHTLAKHQVGLFFLTQGISEHGCSPTKIGEYWAVGLPVVSTANVSDTDELILKNKVGVIIKNHTEEDYKKAIFELLELVEDKDLAERCHQTAASHYNLDSACERQMNLYKVLAKEK